MTIEDVESRLEQAFSKLRSPEYKSLESSLDPLVTRGYRIHVTLLDKKGRKKRKNASADSWSPESGEVRISFEPDVMAGQTKVLSAREIAVKLFAVMREDEALGSQKLAKLAGIEQSDLILPVLQRLEDAGKIIFEDGRWRLPSNVVSEEVKRTEPIRATPKQPSPEAAMVSDQVADLVRSLYRVEARPGYEFIALKWFRDVVLPAEGFDWAQSDSMRQNVLRQAIEKRLVLTSKVPNPKSPQFPVTAIRLNRLLGETQAILGKNGASESDFDPAEIRGEGLSATILRDRR